MPPAKVDDEAIEHIDYENGDSPSNASSSGKEEYGSIGAQHDEHGPVRQPSVAALLRNPLAGKSEEEVLADVDAWVEEKGLQDSREAFRKGALIARVNQREDGFESMKALSEHEKDLLRHEITHRWSQPFMLYFLVILCAGSAIVQGMDQTAVNGAQVRTALRLHYDSADSRARSSTSLSSASQIHGSKAS